MGKAAPPPPLRPVELVPARGGATAGGAMASGAHAHNKLDKDHLLRQQDPLRLRLHLPASTPTSFASK